MAELNKEALEAAYREFNGMYSTSAKPMGACLAVAISAYIDAFPVSEGVKVPAWNNLPEELRVELADCGRNLDMHFGAQYSLDIYNKIRDYLAAAPTVAPQPGEAVPNIFWSCADGLHAEERHVDDWKDECFECGPGEICEFDTATESGKRYGVYLGIETDDEDWRDRCRLFLTKKEAEISITASKAKGDEHD